MSVMERRRHALREWVKQSGDEEVAETLMDLLPPVGWADVATKRDLDVMGGELRAELGKGLSDLRADLQRDLRLQAFWLIGSGWAAVGVLLTVLGR